MCHVLSCPVLSCQVVSFYSWQPPVSGAELAARINAQLEQQWAQTAEAAAAEATAAAAGAVAAESTSSGSSASHQPPHTAEPPAALASSPQPEQLPPVCPLRVWQAEQVPRQFHATFSASWRRYVYLLPLRGGLPAGEALLAALVLLLIVWVMCTTAHLGLVRLR